MRKRLRYAEPMTTNSIGIQKWAANQNVEQVWVTGEGDNQLVGWLRADGARAIETNADPVFDTEEGFEEMWSAR